MEALAALVGQIIGTSLSPEMWIAVAGVLAYAATLRRFVVGLAVATVFLVVLRAALIPNYEVKYALVGIVALIFWSLLGWALRLASAPVVAAIFPLLNWRTGLMRTAIVGSVLWLGFVSWSWMKWEIFESNSQNSCFEERKRDSSKGNPFGCFHRARDPGFEQYEADTTPFQFFATRQLGLALIPGYFLCMVMVAWIFRGFRDHKRLATKPPE